MGFSAAWATFLRGRPLWRRLRSARVQQALLFSHMTGGVMTVCEILAALLHAEKKRQSDSMLFMLRTFRSELGCTFTSLFNHCSGLIERYWDKFLKVVLCLALLVLVFLKIWSLLLKSARIVVPCKGHHERGFVLNSGQGCSFSLLCSL